MDASKVRRVTAVTQWIDLDLTDNVDSFLQWIADNVDHDIDTLEGSYCYSGDYPTRG